MPNTNTHSGTFLREAVSVYGRLLVKSSCARCGNQVVGSVTESLVEDEQRHTESCAAAQQDDQQSDQHTRMMAFFTCAPRLFPAQNAPFGSAHLQAMLGDEYVWVEALAHVYQCKRASCELCALVADFNWDSVDFEAVLEKVMRQHQGKAPRLV